MAFIFHNVLYGIYGIILPIDELMFFKMVESTNQQDFDVFTISHIHYHISPTLLHLYNDMIIILTFEKHTPTPNIKGPQYNVEAKQWPGPWIFSPPK